MERAILKPVAGGVVRHPRTRRPLAEQGEEVLLDVYWRRRLRRGDVVRVAPQRPAAPTPKKA